MIGAHPTDVAERVLCHQLNAQQRQREESNRNLRCMARGRHRWTRQWTVPVDGLAIQSCEDCSASVTRPAIPEDVLRVIRRDQDSELRRQGWRW